MADRRSYGRSAARGTRAAGKARRSDYKLVLDRIRGLHGRGDVISVTIVAGVFTATLGVADNRVSGRASAWIQQAKRKGHISESGRLTEWSSETSNGSAQNGLTVVPEDRYADLRLALYTMPNQPLGDSLSVGITYEELQQLPAFAPYSRAAIGVFLHEHMINALREVRALQGRVFVLTPKGKEVQTSMRSPSIGTPEPVQENRIAQPPPSKPKRSRRTAFSVLHTPELVGQLLVALYYAGNERVVWVRQSVLWAAIYRFVPSANGVAGNAIGRCYFALMNQGLVRRDDSRSAGERYVYSLSSAGVRQLKELPRSDYELFFELEPEEETAFQDAREPENPDPAVGETERASEQETPQDSNEELPGQHPVQAETPLDPGPSADKPTDDELAARMAEMVRAAVAEEVCRATSSLRQEVAELREQLAQARLKDDLSSLTDVQALLEPLFQRALVGWLDALKSELVDPIRQQYSRLDGQVTALGRAIRDLQE